MTAPSTEWSRGGVTSSSESGSAPAAGLTCHSPVRTEEGRGFPLPLLLSHQPVILPMAITGGKVGQESEFHLLITTGLARNGAISQCFLQLSVGRRVSSSLDSMGALRL